jgi:type II secretory pathway component PulF
MRLLGTMIRAWKRRDIMLFLERLELYVAAGLPLNSALEACASMYGERHRRDMHKVKHAVESGGSMARALSQILFIDDTTASLVAHGESSGELGMALASARTLLERKDELRKTCVSAMTYPIVIALFAGVLTLTLMRGVMPQIIPMLRSLHAELPLLTRVVMWFSDALLSYGLIGSISVLSICGLAVLMYAKIPSVRHFCQACLLRLPLAGGLYRDYALSVFLRSCGSLVESGSSSAHAYAQAVSSISLLPLRSSLQREVPEIRKGVGLGRILLSTHMPRHIAALVSAGESSGTLGSSLLRSAGMLDRDIGHALKRLTSLIEPVMMAGMGTVVGAIALSIMMPIYDISKVLQK